MPAPTQKDVNVKLNVSLGADGDRAIKTLSATINAAAAAAMNLAKASQQAVRVGGDAHGPPVVGPSAVGRGIRAGRGDLSVMSKLGMGGIAGRQGTIQGYGEALSELGMTRIGGALANARVAGGIAAVGAGIEASAKAAVILNDRYTTSGQKGRAAFRELVPGGSWVQRQVDSFSGRAAGIEQADIDSRVRRVNQQQEERLSGWSLSNMPTLAGQAERASQLRSASPVFLRSFDQRTGAGRVQAQDEARLVPVRKELARLNREEAVATKERVYAEQELFKLTTRGAALEKERAEAQKKLDADTGSGETRQALIRRANDASAAVQANAELQIQARTALHGANIREAGAKAATAGGRAAELEATAANLEAKAGRSQAAAENFGASDPFERAFMVDSLKTAKQFGFDALTPEQKAAALRAAPMTAGALAESAGSKTREFMELKALAPDEFGDPQALRNQAGRFRELGAREELRGLTAEARQIEESGRSLGTDIGAMIKKAFDEIRREIYHAIFLSRNGQ